MSNLRSIYILLVFLLLLTGCSNNSINETIPVKQETTTVEKTVFVKPKVKKVKVVKKKIVKKKILYKHCSKHTKTMNHALNYIINEFEKGYFLQKDIVGAKAQVFLIENKSPSVFAQNINAAQESYLKQYNLAKKHKCNIKKFKTSPLKKVKNRIKTLEKQKDKK